MTKKFVTQIIPSYNLLSSGYNIGCENLTPLNLILSFASVVFGFFQTFKFYNELFSNCYKLTIK